MQLELATVISCDPGGCRVLPVSGGPVLFANFSAQVIDKVKIRPGQLVAVDMEPAVPEVVWRWYQARIVSADENHVMVQERERQLPVVRRAELDLPASTGDDVWLTRMGEVWEIHDRVVDGNPSNPARLREKVVPRIADLLSRTRQD